MVQWLCVGVCIVVRVMCTTHAMVCGAHRAWITHCSIAQLWICKSCNAPLGAQWPWCLASKAPMAAQHMVLWVHGCMVMWFCGHNLALIQGLEHAIVWLETCSSVFVRRTCSSSVIDLVWRCREGGTPAGHGELMRGARTSPRHRQH